MNRRFRLDYGNLGQAQRTPQGGLSVAASLTRSGVFVYHDDTGAEVREYRPPAEVFRAETLATLKAAPLTVDHPPEKIGPANFRQWTMGHVGDDVRKDGYETSATTYWQDAEAIRAIESGRRQVSCGYHTDVEETPGTVPAGEPDAGMAYDRVQRNILYNHVALVDTGRAGSDVRLRLDSAGNSLSEKGADDMPTDNDPTKAKRIERIDGVDYDVDSDPHRAACTRRDAAAAAAATHLALLTQQHGEAVKARDAEKVRADAADAKLAQVVAGAKAYLSPERIDAMVKTRTALVLKASEVLGKEFKADGMPNKAIKVAIVNKVLGMRLDVADDKITKDYLNGCWTAVERAKPPAQRRDDARDAPIPAHLRTPPKGDGKAGEEGRTLDQVREDAMDAQDERAHRPLALSKRDRFKPRSSGPMLQSAQIENQE